jgi:RHH-type proline utilization regulon transcriptional repressor/proline dehydrogenase/delta 1-pyrroline-5-carboxylate dehydrogenase
MKVYPHNQYYRIDEQEILPKLILASRLNKSDRDSLVDKANDIQNSFNETHYIHKIMKAYELSGPEGMALMTLCEALLRTPDVETQDKLIKEKLSRAQWDQIAENSFYATISGIALTKAQGFALYDTVVKRMGWPAVRKMVKEVVKVMGNLYVMGETVTKAINNKKSDFKYSFDMLGEAALTWDDANSYYEKYIEAAKSFKDSISVKLSAIHPRYELRNAHDVIMHLVPKLAAIARVCEAHNTTMFIDAEETARLDISIYVLEELLKSHRFKKCTIGFAIQSYQKRAFWAINTLENIASEASTELVIRLVKGAYWDTEIKIAQQEGLDYPVFTRKEFTDISYLACARKIMASSILRPAYATHNPFTVAAIFFYNETLGGEFEFQKLYGMGDGLFSQVKSDYGTDIRVYAPVGDHKNLLAYLVRRLLENGANTSFVYNQDVVDPFIEAKKINENLPTYRDIYPNRKNSRGYDLSDPEQIALMHGAPMYHATIEDTLPVEIAIERLDEGRNEWSSKPFAERKKLLLDYADALEESIVPAANSLVFRAYKTYPNAINELREAIDFIRYYVSEAEKLYEVNEIHGYTGEYNNTEYKPRGVWMVIAPWNFPTAIFIGPIVAALITGNTVLAKPAPQTLEIAQLHLSCMYMTGIPFDAVTLCDPDPVEAEKALVDNRICGVTFTGSHPTAKKIHRVLSERDGPIIPFIAETGGINAMIADSTCLPEQLVKDVVSGAFDSAGQRCSATRFLFVQRDNSKEILEMLKGSIKCIEMGFAQDLNTDVTRVIDGDAYRRIQERLGDLEENELLIATRSRNGKELPKLLVSPSAYLVSDYKKYFDKEIFGPLLHVYVYDKEEIYEIIDYINSTRYGLTLGIHSRITSFYEVLADRLNVGNIYVNRDQIGAVVETQPFGGIGLSGTGPKAGGPDYIKSYVWEKHVSINTTAIGGNTVLLSKK